MVGGPAEPQTPTNAAVRRLATLPLSSDGYSALDYGGLVCTPGGNLLLFGGGHAATAIPDVWRLATGSDSWRSDYPVPDRAQIAQAWGTPQLSLKGWYSIPGFSPLPATVHSYSGNVWSHAIGRMLKMSTMAGGYYGGDFPFVSQSIGEYDPAARTWTDTGVIAPWPAPAAVCEDLITGNVVAIINDGFGVYDPRQRKVIHWDTDTSQLLGYDDHIVYFPPNDRFYVITRGYPGTNPAGPRVIEVVVDRTNWKRSMRDLGFTRQPTTDRVASGVLGYAYDPQSQMIVGGLDAGEVHGFHPEHGWFVHEASGAGSMYFHHWAYDESGGRHLFIRGEGGVGDTYAFTPDPAKWRPMPALPPVITAQINSGAFASLEEACNAGVPLTIGPGILAVGAAVTMPGTKSIAGSWSTHIVGGGGVWGKGALVVEVSTTVSGISFENVAVADGNGAGIRHDAGDLAVNDCEFITCQNGYLGNASVAFARCLFDGNGAGDGQTHAIYVSRGALSALITDCIFKNTRIGHHVKSRAERSTVTRCVMDPGTESYSCDFPWGGVVTIDSSTITKGPDSDNDNCVINYGSESNATPFAAHAFTMADSVLTYAAAISKPMVGVRFDGRTPVDAIFRNVHFVGIATPQAGARSAEFINCTRDGAPFG